MAAEETDGEVPAEEETSDVVEDAVENDEKDEKSEDK